MKEELKVYVQRFINGDKEAFEYIFKEEYAKVFARIKSCIRFDNDSIVEDVVQDTFVKVYEKIDTLREIEFFESWMMRIAVNTAKNEIIKNNRITFFEEIPNADGETIENFLENPYEEFQPEREMTRKELEETLEAIFKEIPSCQSMCFQLKEYDGLSYQEISEELNIPLSSVKNNIFYAKKKIKAQIEKRKLYSVAPISFFVWMYRSYVETAEVNDEIAQTAWDLQKELLKNISPEMCGSMSAEILASVATKETAKTIGKYTIGKIVAVVGTMAILGVAGAGILQSIQPKEPEIAQEESMVSEETSIHSEYGEKVFLQEESIKESEINVHGTASTPDQKDMISLEELIEISVSWIGRKKSDAKDSELFLEIVALEKWNNFVVDLDPKYACDSYAIETETLRRLLFECYNYDISLEELEKRDINDKEAHEYQYSQDGMFYYPRKLGGDGAVDFKEMSYEELGRDGDKIVYKCSMTNSGITTLYISTTFFKKGTRTYWTLYDWSTSLNDIYETEDAYGHLKIENVYVGSSPENSEDLGYSIGGEKHFRTDSPVIRYTIDGREYEKEYNNYYIDGYGCEMGYQLADITGDGKEELIVSVYCIGNMLCETLQETYIYSLNEKWKQLDEILAISSDGCEIFISEMPNNCGVYAIDGGIRLDVGSEKYMTDIVFKTVYLRYQEGKWTVDTVNEHEGFANLAQE